MSPRVWTLWYSQAVCKYCLFPVFVQVYSAMPKCLEFRSTGYDKWDILILIIALHTLSPMHGHVGHAHDSCHVRKSYTRHQHIRLL